MPIAFKNRHLYKSPNRNRNRQPTESNIKTLLILADQLGRMEMRPIYQLYWIRFLVIDVRHFIVLNLTVLNHVVYMITTPIQTLLYQTNVLSFIRSRIVLRFQQLLYSMKNQQRVSEIVCLTCQLQMERRYFPPVDRHLQTTYWIVNNKNPIPIVSRDLH